MICTLAGHSQIPNHAKTIIVTGVSFLQVCNALLDSGYTIDKKDNELQTVTTEARDYPKLWNAKYTINIRVKDSTAYITGKSINPVMPDDLEYLTNKKGQPFSKSLYTYPFLLINDFAKAFNKEIQYK